ncbi:hypothetical protein A6769_03925 [Nostoc punctiforme NIES-2108]|uniref:Uncharacterized protein n=1 Tax=Nostoc punctiforme NIES-2108 TaxID=1356359 RepID=A0A367RXU4_NOSPU|nr:hypothetical protein A6769_03925 [Nostoc punctiforme NIES-2108]
MWRVAQFGRALNILVHPLPAKADELGLSIRVREAAGSNPAPLHQIILDFKFNPKSKIFMWQIAQLVERRKTSLFTPCLKRPTN